MSSNSESCFSEWYIWPYDIFSCLLFAQWNLLIHVIQKRMHYIKHYLSPLKGTGWSRLAQRGWCNHHCALLDTPIFMIWYMQAKSAINSSNNNWSKAFCRLSWADFSHSSTLKTTLPFLLPPSCSFLNKKPKVYNYLTASYSRNIEENGLLSMHIHRTNGLGPSKWLQHVAWSKYFYLLAHIYIVWVEPYVGYSQRETFKVDWRCTSASIC